MKTTIKLFLLIAFVFILTSCTENQRAKQFGGKAEVRLNPGKKLVNATWKDDNLWILVRPMNKGEKAITYQFAEESSFGVWEGEYIIYESN